MDPSNQLFGHYLRYRMDMQKRMAEQHNGQPEVKKVSGIGAAIGKLLRNMVSYHKYPATHKESELLQTGPRSSWSNRLTIVFTAHTVQKELWLNDPQFRVNLSTRSPSVMRRSAKS